MRDCVPVHFGSLRELVELAGVSGWDFLVLTICENQDVQQKESKVVLKYQNIFENQNTSAMLL